MPNVRLVSDTANELRFSHSHMGGWVFLAIGAGIAWFGIQRLEETFGSWLMGGMGILFALIGLGAAFWRNDLRLDLLARHYSGRRGFWPSPKPVSGSLDELEGVILSRSWRRSSSSNGGSSEHVVWQLGLDFRGWESPLTFYETHNERQAHEKLEHFCRRLSVSAIDRTGDREIRRSWQELDRSIAEKARQSGGTPGQLTDPPTGSSVLFDRQTGPATIVLPPVGFNVGTVFLLLFGLAWSAFSGFALLAAAGLIDVKVTGSVAAIWIVGSVFLLIGLGICAIGIVGSYAREVIHDNGDGITFSVRFLGWEMRRRTLPKSEVEEIDLQASTTSRRRGRGRLRINGVDIGRLGSSKKGSTPRQIVVRTDRRIVRLANNLDPEDQAWLHQTLTYLTSR